MREVIRGVRLEKDARHRPLLSKTIADRGRVELAMEPSLEEAEAPFEHGGWSGKAVSDQLRRRNPSVSSPATVHPFDRASGTVRLDDARGHRGRNAYRMRDLLSVEAVQESRRHRGPQCATDRCGVLAVLEED